MEHIVQGKAGELSINLIALGLQSQPVTLGGVLGQYWVDGPTLNIGTIPASALNSTPISLPNNLDLVGLPLGFQSLLSGSAGWQFTNAADCFLHN